MAASGSKQGGMDGSGSGGGSDGDRPIMEGEEKYLRSFPPGYRFCPTDQELIKEYLEKKVLNKRLSPSMIREVELCKYNPQELAERYPQPEDNWYFFSPRNRKYRNGIRPNRAAGDGYWKPTGKDKAIYDIDSVDRKVGYMKRLDYYQGTHDDGQKTQWKMLEYRIAEKSAPASTKNGGDPMKLDDWVLCKIYKKLKSKKKDEGACSKDSKSSNVDQALSQPEVLDSSFSAQPLQVYPQQQVYKWKSSSSSTLPLQINPQQQILNSTQVNPQQQVLNSAWKPSSSAKPLQINPQQQILDSPQINPQQQVLNSSGKSSSSAQPFQINPEQQLLNSMWKPTSSKKPLQINPQQQILDSTQINPHQEVLNSIWKHRLSTQRQQQILDSIWKPNFSAQPPQINPSVPSKSTLSKSVQTNLPSNNLIDYEDDDDADDDDLFRSVQDLQNPYNDQLE